MGFSLGNNSDVTFYIDGQKIGEMQTINATTVEYESPGVREFNFNRSATLTMENATISKDFLNQFLPQDDPTYEVHIYSPKIKRLTYLLNRTKKTRIRNKLTKRISKLDHPFFHKPLTMKASQIKFKGGKGYEF